MNLFPKPNWKPMVIFVSYMSPFQWRGEIIIIEKYSKYSDPNPDPDPLLWKGGSEDPDPLLPNVDPRIRIRIHIKMRWIRNGAVNQSWWKNPFFMCSSLGRAPLKSPFLKKTSLWKPPLKKGLCKPERSKYFMYIQRTDLQFFRGPECETFKNSVFSQKPSGLLFDVLLFIFHRRKSLTKNQGKRSILLINKIFLCVIHRMSVGKKADSFQVLPSA